MNWHYQIIKKKDGFGIFEIYKNKKGVIEGFSEDPMTGFYGTKKELLENLSLMQKDSKRWPVLK